MGTGYVRFTEEQRERAHRADLVSLLKSQGERLKRSGSEHEWRDGSQKVTIRGNLWFHQYDREGGDAVGFVRRFYNMTYPEAVGYLLGEGPGELAASPPVPKETVEFKLPPKNDNMCRAYGYLLNRRGIDRGVLVAFVCRGMVYESAGHHNVVFVGYDKEGTARHASLRGTGEGKAFKGNAPGSLPGYSFHWDGRSRYLCLFEAPIDLLSFISMHKRGWQAHSYAAACCLSDQVLSQCLADNPHIRYVYLCLDNDGPGQAAAGRIRERLDTQGIPSQILLPSHKDWNEDLLHQGQKEEREVEAPCQGLQF